MAEEKPVVETPEETPEETPAGTPAAQPPSEVAELKRRLGEYERLVLSPEYAEYLQAKAAGAKPPGAAAPTKEQREEFQEKLTNMGRAEFAAFIRDAVVSDVCEKLFTPLAQTIVQDRVQQQIAAAQVKYPDFLDYREKMIEISQANPNLNAEQTYLLAKGVASSASLKNPATKPTEVPRGTPASGPKPKDKLGFNAAFDEAYKKAGLKE